MESQSPLQTFLRVLYTVNSNPQYILAKSLSPVPAIPCNETSQCATAEPAYARVPLKACLAVVCASSPELLQDPARDFSLYVLDPLEAQPPPSSLANPSHNTNSPRGVAVALGLMSWALESNDSTNVLVAGTVILNASPALEVVFALRETKRMPKPVVYSYPSYGPVPGPSSSQLPNYPYAVAGMGWVSAPSLQQHNQQEQRTLTRSSEFPELYIGPPRRARGRPEGSTSSKPKVKSQDSAFSQPGPSSSTAAGSYLESTQERKAKAKQKGKARSQKPPLTHSPFIRAPLNRHSTRGSPETGETGTPAVYPQSHSTSQDQSQSHIPHHSQGHPHAHPSHDALVGLLSAISSSSGNTTTNTTPEQQANLLLALQGLLSSNPHLLQPASTNAGLSVDNAQQTTETRATHGESNADDEHNDGDSDIVILDSSTVDTTAFRKAGSRDITANGDGTSSLTNNQEDTMSSSQGTDCSPLPASTPPSGQENTPSSSKVSTPSMAFDSTPTVSPEAKIPNSRQVSPGQTERNDIISQCTLDMPETPTPCRTRKRKLDEYVQGQTRSPPPTSPPSPSLSVALTSKQGRDLTGRQRVQSSPVRGPALVSSPLARLPSMLGSMRAAAASSSRTRDNSSSSSVHLVPSTTKNNGNQTTTLASGSSKVDRSATTNVSSNTLGLGSGSLKRRRTLNEVMAEQEARKLRKRSSSGRNSKDPPAPAPQAASTQFTRMPSASRHAQSSPPRPLFRSNLMAFSSTSTFHPGLAGMTVSNLASSSMTAKPPSISNLSATLTKNPAKKFVLPDWARTGTATLPRLSEEALARQRAEQEAKKAQASLKRREAAKAKRKRLHVAGRPSQESSDEDDDTTVDDVTRPIIHPSSSVVRNVPPPPPPSLPVFASDAVEPIPSSPPQSRSQFTLPNVPSTPPRKPRSSGSGSHRTPGKSGSCSLFTPSGQDPGSLFTPSTPSVARSLTRATFTPRSPIVFHRSGVKGSPRKSTAQTPWTPKRNNNQTPKSLRVGRNSQFVSPGMAIRTPQTQTGREMRAFLLPPPSPCASGTSHVRVHSRDPTDLTANVSEGAEIVKRGSPSDKRNNEQDKSRKEEDIPSCDPGDTLRGEGTSISPEHCHGDQGERQEISQLCNIDTDGDALRAEKEYASSPLPPSSPLPTSPFSSPERLHGSNYDSSPTINSLSVVPDSDILLPSVGDSDGPGTDMDWLSDDAGTASWFTDPETWLTDTEGGPYPTDSDVGTWLSDSDAIGFGDMSASLLVPSGSASNWFSDDADVDTDAELVEANGAHRNGGLDSVAAAFERAFEALVQQRGAGESAASKNEPESDGGGDGGGAAGVVEVGTELWESLRPLFGGNGPNDVGGAAAGGVGESVSGEKTVQELQELLKGFVDA